MGIPAERLATIFEPLYTTKPGGTGLGLYIVQEIVAAHAGQVTVESVEGQGTTVTVTQPSFDPPGNVTWPGLNDSEKPGASGTVSVPPPVVAVTQSWLTVVKGKR